MSWAAKRVTKRKEDIAYCLLGIFGVMMPMVYGEGDQAFSRLQEMIMKHIQDDSILAWAFDPQESVSTSSKDIMTGGILAAAPADFANSGHIISREQPQSPLEISGGRLRIQLPLFTSSTGKIYGLLSCGPDSEMERVVGIPLISNVPNGLSNEYIRPEGHYLTSFPWISNSSTELIHIQIAHRSRAHIGVNRRHWFYIEDPSEANLELVDVEPPVRWQKARSMITTENNTDGSFTQWTLTRFRTKSQASCDFIVVLEFKAQGSQVEARCHAMISSRDTTLEALSQKLVNMRPEAFGKQRASNGILNIYANVKQKSIIGQPMFVVKLATTPGLPKMTVDATAELQLLDLQLELEGILQEENDMRLQAEQLRQQKKEITRDLQQMSGRLVVVKEKLSKLVEEKRNLEDDLVIGAKRVDEITIRGAEISQRRDMLSGQRSEMIPCLRSLLKNHVDVTAILKDPFKQVRLWADVEEKESTIKLLLTISQVDIESKGDSGRTLLSWAASYGHEATLRSLLDKGANIESKDNGGRVPLSYASEGGHEAVVRLLLAKGTDIESKDNGGRVPLSYAADGGHEAVVQLLLAKGADIELKDNGGRVPLSWAAERGHEAVVRLLLDKGANIESKDNNGRVPLSWAAEAGHEAVVRLLLNKGANVELKDNRLGQTPLLYAAKEGHEAVVRLLLDNGAEVMSKNYVGQTPLFYADERGHTAVLRLLQSYYVRSF